MTWDEALAAVAHLPGIEVSTSYGTPSLKIAGKFLTRLRAEDDSLVLLEVEPEEIEMLIADQPAIFHITPHYVGHRAVLARIAALPPETLAHHIERRWRAVAPRRAVKAYDSSAPA